MRYAVFMLIFGKPHYMIGACINAYIQRKFIDSLKCDSLKESKKEETKTQKAKIELIAMVDSNTYKYKTQMLKYFDDVKLIDMFEVKHNKDYNILDKYKDVMSKLINKWQIFNYTEYDKILFCDVDIIPITKEFYDLFNLNTPAIVTKTIQNDLGVKVKHANYLDFKTKIKESDYFQISTKLKATLDGGLVLIEPSKTTYKDLLKFIKVAEGPNGYISSRVSGSDETLLLLYWILWNPTDLYHIPYDYQVITWEKLFKYKNIYALNYLSYIKPWTKFQFLEWGEEVVWNKIADIIFKKNTILYKIYIQSCFENLSDFYKNFKEETTRKSCRYNIEFLKDSEKKVKFMEVCEAVEKSKDEIFDDYDYDIVKALVNEINNTFDIPKGDKYCQLLLDFIKD